MATIDNLAGHEVAAHRQFPGHAEEAFHGAADLLAHVDFDLDLDVDLDVDLDDPARQELSQA